MANGSNIGAVSALDHARPRATTVGQPPRVCFPFLGVYLICRTPSLRHHDGRSTRLRAIAPSPTRNRARRSETQCPATIATAALPWQTWPSMEWSHAIACIDFGISHFGGFGCARREACRARHRHTRDAVSALVRARPRATTVGQPPRVCFPFLGVYQSGGVGSPSLRSMGETDHHDNDEREPKGEAVKHR
jgi:hypothetical protein